MAHQRHCASALAGVNVICHATASSGLAVAARNTLRTLENAGIPVAVLDVDTRDSRSGRDVSCADRIGDDAPHSVNLFHLNPPEIVRLIQAGPKWLDLKGKINACVPFWELPRTPGSWTAVLQAMDLVLAPTRFVLEAVGTGAPRALLRHYPQAAYLPEGLRPNRSELRIPEGPCVFLLSFDLTSDVERKNPYAVLDAFKAMGLTAGEARLVVKLGNTDYSRSTRAAAGRLRRRVESNPGVLLVDEHLSYRDMLTLTASCDVLVTLHRSEGLGLNLLEAMSLGKPVVTTGWSGNMDFTNERNSCLVPFSLVPVVSSHPAYRPGAIGGEQKWAEPDVAAATAFMRQLATDKNLRLTLGDHAQRDMERLRNDPARWEPITDLISESTGIVNSDEHAVRAAQLRALGSVPIATRIRRTAVATLRALGVTR